MSKKQKEFGTKSKTVGETATKAKNQEKNFQDTEFQMEEPELQEAITLIDENNQEVDFYILEETRINGKNYILVANELDEDNEAEALILVDTSKEDEEEAVYEIVDDEEELNSLSKIFSELMDDTNIELSIDE